jgi:hypothetical protein
MQIQCGYVLFLHIDPLTNRDLRILTLNFIAIAACKLLIKLEIKVPVHVFNATPESNSEQVQLVSSALTTPNA